MRSCNSCCRGKAVTITYSEYVSVALVIQQAKCMVHIIKPSVTCLDLKDFSSLPQKRYDSRKQLMNIRVKRVLIFSATFVRNTRGSQKVPGNVV